MVGGASAAALRCGSRPTPITCQPSAASLMAVDLPMPELAPVTSATRLASCGAQRVVRLGEAGPSTIGNPHDAMYPLHRFVHWMAHEDGPGPH